MRGKNAKWYAHVEYSEENSIMKLVNKYKPCGRHGFG
jgi:hypothetical protein